MSGSSASLSFDIDSSAAQRAVSVLQTLVQQSQQTLAATTQLKTATTDLTSAYAQNAGQLSRLAEQTKTFGGTLGGLVSQLNQLRTAITSVSGGNLFAGYARMMNEAQAVAAQINTSVDSIDRFVTKARQLNITAEDLATGLTRISAALKSQTAEGMQANLVLTELGVRLSGISPNQPNLVLQQLADQLRKIQDPTLQLNAAQRVLGPSFAAQDVQSLVRQPIVPYWQGYQQQRQADVQAQIDRQQVGVQAMNLQSNRQQAQLADDSSRFTRFPGAGFIGGRLGAADFFANFFTPDRQLAAEYRRIAQLPDEQRRPYERQGEGFNRLYENDPAIRAIRNITSGTAMSNAAEIGERFRQDRFNEGFFPAFATGVGRGFQNIAGPLFGSPYQPISQAEREGLKTPEQRAAERRQAAETLADPSIGLSRAQNILTQRANLAPGMQEPLRDALQKALGQGEGQREFGINLENQIRRLNDLVRPETPLLRQADQQRYMRGLTVGDRGLADYGAQYYRQVTGQEYQPTAGAPAEAALGSPNLSASARQAGAVLRQEQQLGYRQEDSETTQRVIQQQDELSAALGRGQGAAEDANRTFIAFFDALQKGRDVPRANEAALDALNVAMAQRITQGKAFVQQLHEENLATQARITSVAQYANADPITRAAAATTLGVNQQVEQQIRAGRLPNPAGGQTFIRDAAGNVTGTRIDALSAEQRANAQATVDAARQELFQQQAQQGAMAAQAQGAGLRGALETSQRQGALMGQGFTGQQAQERAEAEKTLAEAAGRAQAAMQATANATDEAGKHAHELAEQALKTVEAQQASLAEQMKQLDAERSILEAMQQIRTVAEETSRTLAQMQVGDAFRQAAGEFEQILMGILKGASAVTPGAATDSGTRATYSGIYGIVAGAESGGRDIVQTGGAHGPSGPAEGFVQIEPDTWREFAPKAGISLNQYPRPLGAPPAIQAQVASAIPGNRWAPGTRQAMLAAHPGIDLRKPLGDIAVSVGETRQPTVLSQSQAPAVGGGGGDGGLAGINVSQAQLNNLVVTAIQRGQPIPKGALGLPDETIDQINAAAATVRQKRGTMIAATTQQMNEALQRELDAQHARIGILQSGGGPGQVARVVTRPAGLTDAEWQQRQGIEQQRVVGGQQVGAAGTAAEEERIIQQQREALQTYNGTLAEQIAKAREAAATQEALNAQWRNPAIDVATEKTRQMIIELGKETDATMKQVQAAQTAIERGAAGAAATPGGPLAVQKAQDLFDINQKIEALRINRANATDDREVAAIDAEIAANQKLIATYDQRILQQQKIQTGLQAEQMGRTQQLQIANNALGPFATPLDEDRTRRYMEMAQKFAATPGLEQSAQGQQLLKANQAQDAINQQTQAMQEYRDAAHQAGSAIEQAFSSVIDRSQTAGQAVQGLGNALEKIAINTFVIKPFEKLMDSAFSSLFGGTPEPGSQGDTKGPGGDVYDIFGRLMRGEAGGATNGQGNSISGDQGTGGSTTGGTSTGGGDVNTGGGDIVNVGGAVNVAMNGATGGGMANCCGGGHGIGGLASGGSGGGAGGSTSQIGNVGWVGDVVGNNAGATRNIAAGDNTGGSQTDMANAIKAQTALVSDGSGTSTANAGLLAGNGGPVPFQLPHSEQTANQGTIQDPSAWGGPISGYQSDIQNAVDRLKVSNSDADFSQYQKGIVNFWNAVNHGEYYVSPSGESFAQSGGLDPTLRHALETGSPVPDNYGYMLDYPPFWFVNHDPGASTAGGKYYSVPSGVNPSSVLPPSNSPPVGPMYDLSTGQPYAANNIGGFTTPGYGSYSLYGGGGGGDGSSGGGSTISDAVSNFLSFSGDGSGSGSGSSGSGDGSGGSSSGSGDGSGDGSGGGASFKSVVGNVGGTLASLTGGPIGGLGRAVQQQFGGQKGGFLSNILGHAGGFTGWMTDKILGEGSYKGGGLIGKLFGSSDSKGGGSGGSGGSGSGYVDNGRFDTSDGAAVNNVSSYDIAGNTTGQSLSGTGDGSVFQDVPGAFGDTGAASDMFGGFGAFDNFGSAFGDIGGEFGDAAGAFGDAAGAFGDAGGAVADIGSVAGDLGGLYAKGGVPGARRFSRGGMPRRFANGGATGLASMRNTVVHAPTVFRFAGGGQTGVAGEAGSEAILPLRRDGSGRLGVSAGNFGGGGGGQTVHNHTWNISTPDANSFMRTQNQVQNSVNLSMQKARARNSP